MMIENERLNCDILEEREVQAMKITKETIRRALRTFCQTAIGHIAVNVTVIDFTDGKEVMKSAIIGLLISAIASGISAVMNLEEKDE